MRLRLLITALACMFSFPGALVAQSDQGEKAAFELLKKVAQGTPLGSLTPTELPNGTKALTVVFRKTDWLLKLHMQEFGVAMRLREEAMALPEEQRLKKMDKIENNVQFWLVPTEGRGDIGASLKESLPPNKDPHENYREMAFLGRGYGFAWFAYAPIDLWTRIQKKLRLQGGDDPLEAAFRGTKVKDPGKTSGYTALVCVHILAAGGAKAIPWVEKAIQEKLPDRPTLICELAESEDKEVTQWLLQQVGSKDPDLSRNAREALISNPRKEAIPFYSFWLQEYVGREDVRDLLRACKKMDVPGRRDFLLKILQSPTDVAEYRVAFQMERESRGAQIPKDLLECEQAIETFGVPYEWGGQFDIKKVRDAQKVILASDDLDAAAAIGISLTTLPGGKGGLPPAVRDAGIYILKNIRNGKGIALVSRLAPFNKYHELDEIAQALGIGK